MVVNLNDLNNIFSKAFEQPTTVTAESQRDEFGQWDSINHLNLIVELEDFYSVRFTMDEIKAMTSVKAIIDTIQSK